MKKAPIALFDSGSGGLAVLKHLQRRLPFESILYLGDLANLPVGEKPAETIQRLALSNGKFLEKLGAKLLLIACNTFSAIGLEILQKSLSIPVLGVIEPCAEKVAQVSHGKVGVLATNAVIRSRGYEKAILNYFPRAEIHAVACPTLAYLIEQGLHNHPATPFIVEAAVHKFIKVKIDTLVLGCTHYPLILPHIKKTLGDDVKIVDSAEACIDKLIQLLREKDLHTDSREAGKERYFTSASAEAFQRVAPLFLEKTIPLPEHYEQK